MKLRILLVNPPRVKDMPVVREERYEHRDVGSVYPPLSILQGAASLRKAGFDVKVMDANGFNLKLEHIGRLLSDWQPHYGRHPHGLRLPRRRLEGFAIGQGQRSQLRDGLRNKMISEVSWLMPSIVQTSRSGPLSHRRVGHDSAVPGENLGIRH